MAQNFLLLLFVAIFAIVVAVLLLIGVTYLAPLIVTGAFVGGIVGAAVGFFGSGSPLVAAGIGAAIGSLLFTVSLLDGDLVDKGPASGAVVGGLAALFLTSDPVLPALAAVAGACAGTFFPPTDRLEDREPSQPSREEPDESSDVPVRGIE